MNTPGRPTLFKPEYCAIARTYCMLGAINAELADHFDVAPRTIDKWIAEQPEFAAAVREGRDEADATVVGQLYGRALGYTFEAKREVLHDGKPVALRRDVHYPADVRACMYWLRNRRRKQWGDGQAPAKEPINWNVLNEAMARAEREKREDREAADGGS